MNFYIKHVVYDLGIYPGIAIVFSALLQVTQRSNLMAGFGIPKKFFGICGTLQNKISDMPIISNEFGIHNIIVTLMSPNRRKQIPVLSNLPNLVGNLVPQGFLV